jgi:hypothetical protein
MPMAKPSPTLLQKIMGSHFLRLSFSSVQGFSYSPPTKRDEINFRRERMGAGGSAVDVMKLARLEWPGVWKGLDK